MNCNSASSSPTLIDSHCHLDLPAFDGDREAVLDECATMQLSHIMIPAVSPNQVADQFALIDHLNARNQGVQLLGAVGLHPCWVHEYALSDPSFQALDAQLRSTLQHPHCLAIGELGLDKFAKAPFAQQLSAFEIQLQLAQSIELPVIIHVRKAHNETLNLLNKYKPLSGGVIHAFSGSLELAQQYWDLGFYLGVGGTITYERANKTRSAIANMPLAALVLETDAPDMPLCGYQGKSNSPIQLPKILRALATLKQMPDAAVADTTTHNSRDLFKLDKID